MVTPGWKDWEEIREEARATLQRVADDAPDMAPGELLQLLAEVTDTARTLAQIACEEWGVRQDVPWAKECARLVRERMRSQGFPLCCYPTCFHEARPVAVGIATICMCQMHADERRAYQAQFNPISEEPLILSADDHLQLDLEAS